MNILTVDGVPCNSLDSTQAEAAPLPRMSTAQKIKMLRSNDEDYEWYPTTQEIIAAVEKDIFKYLNEHINDYSTHYRRDRDKVRLGSNYHREETWLDIESMLDIGAGDGRVLEHFKADKKYGIEIANAQADDLIRRGIFLIGRNFWDVSLMEQDFGLVFCNPPYSDYAVWVNKILYECNFEILYLVIPIRWKNEEKITKELGRYDATVVGEFDFSKADRAARGTVNLVRVNAPWEQVEFGSERERLVQKTMEDAFSRWVRENIASFEKKESLNWEAEKEQELTLKNTPIEQLVDDYETEKENLGDAFRSIGKLNPEIIKLMGQNKESMLEIIRKSIEGLKSKYWRAAFDKLDPVRGRMTRRTRDRIFNEITEFKKMDFNVDNIYSIVIWIINNSNIGILDQIGEVFDAMTNKNYIEKYKSNRHWAKSDWLANKDMRDNWRYRDIPERWKIGLDYRIVLHTYFQSYDKYGIVDDFIIICKNLGFPIRKWQEPNYTLHSAAQEFYTENGELAFTMRYYTGNKNAHLKINKKLLMKFNVEVAKIRKWMSDPDDVVEEYGIEKDEAAKLWNSGIALIGSSDIPMLEFKEVS